LSEREAAVKERDEKIAMLESKLSDSVTHADSLTSRLNDQELVIASKERQISELNSVIEDRSRYDDNYCLTCSDVCLLKINNYSETIAVLCIDQRNSQFFVIVFSMTFAFLCNKKMIP